MCAELARRGYTLDTATRAMGMVLDGFRLSARNSNSHRWSGRSICARLDCRLVSDCRNSTSSRWLTDRDCGIYNVTTLERVRRRGLGTALTSLQLHGAQARGCRTASIKSTEIAEHVYPRVGLRDLGRILEFVPPDQALS